MAYAMSTLVAMFLCMALVVVHVDSARLLLQEGNDTMGMTAGTSSTTEDSAAQGTPPAADEAAEFQSASTSDTTTDAIVYNKDAVTTDPTTDAFAVQSIDLTKQASTEESGDEENLVPPTDAIFAQEDSVTPDTLYNLNDDFPAPFAADRLSGSDATAEPFDSGDQETVGADSTDSADLVAFADQENLEGNSKRTLGSEFQDSFASEKQGFLVGDSQGTVGSENYDFQYDATKRDAVYPADSNAVASEFALAEANSLFRSDESENSSSADEPQFEFDQDSTP